MKKFINVLVVLLLAFSTAVSVYLAANSTGTPSKLVFYIIAAVTSLIILYYSLFGYKKPHGNLLRYTYIIFGAATILGTVLLTRFSGQSYTVTINVVLTNLVGMISLYMAGRLNKIEKNKVLTIVGFVLLAGVTVFKIVAIDIKHSTSISTVLVIVGTLATLFQWCALSLSYTLRFKEHKEAGEEQ